MEKNNLLKAIKADHQVVSREFSVLKRGLGAKQSILASLLVQIQEHFAKEEKLLFGKLEKHSRLSGEATAALVQDHQAILNKWEALNALDVSQAEWSTQLEALAEMLEEHFRYEEDIYFKFVRAGFSKAELEALVGEKSEEIPEKALPKKKETKAVKKSSPTGVKKAPAKKPALKKETVKKAEKKPTDKKSTAKSVTKKTTTKTKTTPSK